MSTTFPNSVLYTDIHLVKDGSGEIRNSRLSVFVLNLVSKPQTLVTQPTYVATLTKLDGVKIDGSISKSYVNSKNVSEKLLYHPS